MYGIGVTTLKGPLEIVDLPAPRPPGDGEVLLDMIAGGVGAWDALVPDGVWEVDFAPPAAIGVEGVGRVAAVGSGVSDLVVGEVVVVHEAPLPNGSGLWAEQALVTAAHAARVPEGLSTRVAAALPVGGLTAVQSLDELGVDARTRLLVVGASGPTAALAVQLAHQRGAYVVAGAGARHAERLAGYGADEVVDTHAEAWADEVGARFDAVLIAATGTADAALGLLVDGGRLVSITSDAPEAVRGITSTDLYVAADGAALGELASLAAAGHLVLDVEATPVSEGIPIVERVTRGRSGGVKHVLEF